MDRKSITKKVTASFVENRKTYIAAFLAFMAGLALCIGIRLITEGANIETSQGLESAIPGRIWDTVASGDVEKYKELVSNDEFFEALSEYHSEIIAKLSKVKDVKVEVQVLMAGKHAETAKTANCYNWFKNQDYHVELVIPKSYSDHKLSWLRCDSSWPEMYLTLEVNGILLETPVKLVGARRNGNANNPVLLISQKIAQDLGLDGWKEYKSKAIGTISLATAK